MVLTKQHYAAIMDVQNLTTTIAPTISTIATISTTPSKYIGELCGEDFQNFRITFKYYHGYISAVICIFGIIANILNIIVLTRKHMISSINTLLTGLAVADMIVMLDYLPYTINHNIVVDHIPDVDYYTYDRMVIILIFDHVLVVGHTMAIAFTLTLAIWRYIAVNYPLKASHWCNMHRTRITIWICFLLPIIIYIPAFLCFSVQKEKNNEKFFIGLTSMANSNNQLLYRAVFWMFSVLIKVVPCFVLTIFSLLLVRGLYKAGKMKKKLVQRSVSGVNDQQIRDRTTKMLLAVLVLFLVTEFPVGVMGLMAAVLGDKFYFTCYLHFREVRTLITLINSSLNFVIYCTMSRRFRETFVDMFKLKICTKLKLNGIAKSQEFDTEVTTSI